MELCPSKPEDKPDKEQNWKVSEMDFSLYFIFDGYTPITGSLFWCSVKFLKIFSFLTYQIFSLYLIC